MKLPVGVKVFAHNQRFCGKNPAKNVVPENIMKTITEGEASHDKASGKPGRKLAEAIKKVEARNPGNQKTETAKTEPEKTGAPTR